MGDYIWNKNGKDIPRHLLLNYHRIYSKNQKKHLCLFGAKDVFFAPCGECI